MGQVLGWVRQGGEGEGKGREGKGREGKGRRRRLCSQLGGIEGEHCKQKTLIAICT